MDSLARDGTELATDKELAKRQRQIARKTKKAAQEARVRQLPDTQRQSAVHEKFLEYKAEQAHKVFLARRTMARSICDIDWSIDDKTQEEWAKQRDAWATSSKQAKSGKARNVWVNLIDLARFYSHGREWKGGRSLVAARTSMNDWEVDDKECGFEEEYPSSEEVEYEYPGEQEYPDPFEEVQYGYPDE
ncbi:hypothetical protein D6D29_07124 [Aureobasidium pullulans]|nr:hypothetical protein D6D29_07124 [Aureobasidium pullulans]